MRDQKILRENLKKVLKYRNLNQHDLAGLLKIDYDYLRRMLQKGYIQKYRFDEIAKILDIHPGYLSGEANKIHNLDNYRQISEEGDYELIDENEQYVLIDDLLDNKEYYEKKYGTRMFRDISYKAHNSMDFIEIINMLTKIFMGRTITEEEPVYTREDYENMLNKTRDLIKSTYLHTYLGTRTIPIIRNKPLHSLPDDSPFYKK